MKRLIAIFTICTIWVASFAQPLQNPATIGSSSRNQRIVKSLAVGDTLLTGGVVGINTDTPTNTANGDDVDAIGGKITINKLS
jgi:hypothetical protein